VKVAQGNPIRIVGFLRDISERKQSEDERKKLAVQLQEAHKMEAIGTLAGGIAHDFNNILTPIIVRTEMALSGIPEEINARDHLKHVLKAGIRAKELVQQILTFSRQSQDERTPLNFGLIVKETIKLLRSSLPTTIEIRLNIERVQYKKVTWIKLPTASPRLCCYQTYFLLPPILFDKHFSAYPSGLMNVEGLYFPHAPASKTILFP